MTDVSVIIVNYKTASLICDAINSIYNSHPKVKFEIIVVDNNSQDNIEKELSEKFPSYFNSTIKLLLLSENIGFGRASNEAVKLASGQYLFHLNPDTILLDNAIDLLYNYLTTHPDCGMVGTNLLGPNLTPVLAFKRRYPGLAWEVNELFNLIPDKIRFGKNITYNFTDHPLNVAYITGADMMMPTKVFNDIGGFKDDFFMYYEDTDLCYRVKKAGYNIVALPNPAIQHLEGQSMISSQRVNSPKIQRIETGRLTYLKLNTSPLVFSICNFIYSLTLLSRSLLLGKSSIKGDTWRERRRIFHLLKKNY